MSHENERNNCIHSSEIFSTHVKYLIITMIFGFDSRHNLSFKNGLVIELLPCEDNCLAISKEVSNVIMKFNIAQNVIRIIVVLASSRQLNNYLSPVRIS